MKDILGGTTVWPETNHHSVFDELVQVENWKMVKLIMPHKCAISKRWMPPLTKCYYGGFMQLQGKPLMMDGRGQNEPDVFQHSFYISKEEFLMAKLKGLF